MDKNKLIAKYKRKINIFRKERNFFEQSYDLNLDAGRKIIAKELAIKVSKLNSKIRVYNNVIDDLKTLT